MALQTFRVIGMKLEAEDAEGGGPIPEDPEVAGPLAGLAEPDHLGPGTK